MIRLQRVGRRNDPSYRVVLTDKRNAPQSGKFKEILGSYDPRNDAPQLKSERITHWIEQGAQPSDTVHNLLISQGIIKGTKINVLPKKSPVVDDLPAQAGEAIKKAEEVKKTEEEAKMAEAEAPVEEAKEEEALIEEAPAEETAFAEASDGQGKEEEASDSDEATSDMPVEEEKAEEAPEEKKEESEPEETPEEEKKEE